MSLPPPTPLHLRHLHAAACPARAAHGLAAAATRSGALSSKAMRLQCMTVWVRIRALLSSCSARSPRTTVLDAPCCGAVSPLLRFRRSCLDYGWKSATKLVQLALLLFGLILL